MIDSELEASLSMAFAQCRKQRCEYITVEHLLMALLDNSSSSVVLLACSASLHELRNSLAHFMAQKRLVVVYGQLKILTRAIFGLDHEVDTSPTLGFSRVIQRAIMHVQSLGDDKRNVTGADVLVAVFGELDSHAVQCLHQQSVTRLDVVSFIAHGIKKTDQASAGLQSESVSRLSSDNVQVVLVNDDYTPMEFVVTVLQIYFDLDSQAATQIMLKIHQEGRAVCGVLSKDVANTKMGLVSDAARQGGHPLKCIAEAA